jgi:hypothetical protein
MADKPLACDVIVVDGGHDYEVAKADLQSMRAFARSPRHLLIMDDTPCVAYYCDGPNRAWRESRDFIKLYTIRQGKVADFGCTLSLQRIIKHSLYSKFHQQAFRHSRSAKSSELKFSSLTIFW